MTAFHTHHRGKFFLPNNSFYIFGTKCYFHFFPIAQSDGIQGIDFPVGPFKWFGNFSITPNRKYLYIYSTFFKTIKVRMGFAAEICVKNYTISDNRSQYIIMCVHQGSLEMKLPRPPGWLGRTGLLRIGRK